MKLCTQSIRKVNAGSATEWIVGCGGALIGNFEVGRHGLPSTPRAVFSADLQTIGTLVQALKTIARKPVSSPTPFVENLQNWWKVLLECTHPVVQIDTKLMQNNGFSGEAKLFLSFSSWGSCADAWPLTIDQQETRPHNNNKIFFHFLRNGFKDLTWLGVSRHLPSSSKVLVIMNRLCISLSHPPHYLTLTNISEGKNEGKVVRVSSKFVRTCRHKYLCGYMLQLQSKCKCQICAISWKERMSGWWQHRKNIIMGRWVKATGRMLKCCKRGRFPDSCRKPRDIPTGI